MPFDPGDAIRVTARMIHGADQLFNVHHLQYGGSAIATTDADIMADIVDYLEQIYVNLEAHQADDYTYFLVDFFNETQNAPIGTVNWNSLAAGLAAQDPLPAGVAAVMRASLGLPKREGKKYTGGFAEGANDTAGQIAGGAFAAINAASVAWITPGTFGAGLTNVIPKVKTVQLGVNVYVSPVASLVDDIWDYQRRRKEGKGI